MIAENVQREICLRLANGDRHMSTHVVEREHDGRRVLYALPMYLEREVDGVLYLFILDTPASAPLPRYVEVERRGKVVPTMHVLGGRANAYERAGFVVDEDT